MSVLHIEHVPDDLYQRIEELAVSGGVSIGQQTVRLLQRAVIQQAPPQGDVLAILAELRRGAIVPMPGTPDSVDLLREDRQR
jgi:hypothetical protein